MDKNIPKGFPITFESILLIYSFAFYNLNLNKISGVVASSNIGAIKLNDFVKMRREGILRQQFIFEPTLLENQPIFSIKFVQCVRNRKWILMFLNVC